ncbi:MAG: transposase [Chloroflexi bacterium]|nr:transposase [Chloroflexota bacterium]
MDAWLYRQPYQRRSQVSGHTRAICQRCGSQEASDFLRNGRRPRQLVTEYGVLRFWLPRLRCQCHGSVRIPFSILKPYQQIWEDVTEQIGRWADLGLSLRQMQAEIGEQMGAQVGLRTLNQEAQALRMSPDLELTRCPPVVMLDAIWMTLLADTGQTKADSRQRQRPVKARRKVCVLVALGLYPQSRRWGILGWQLAEDESRKSWQSLLLGLAQRKLHRQRGLELFIHDGSKGLIAALNYLHPHVRRQRCIFHKLRNLWQRIQVAESLTSQQARQFKRRLLQAIRAIFEAKDNRQATELQQAFCKDFAHTQPDLVATLQRDWPETIAFFRVLQRYPKWPRSALRSTVSWNGSIAC